MASSLSGMDTPLSIPDSLASDESDAETRRYLSCPARLGARAGSLKRRSAPPIWEIDYEQAPSPEPFHDSRSLSERVSDHERRSGASPSIHDSWPRVRKQRSDEDGRSMTLWQLSHAISRAAGQPSAEEPLFPPPAKAKNASFDRGRRHFAPPASRRGRAAPPLAQPPAGGKVDSPFNNAFVDAVLGIDNMHVADAAAARGDGGTLPDGSEINLALMQLEALAAEAREEGPMDLLGGDDFDPAELLAVLDCASPHGPLSPSVPAPESEAVPEVEPPYGEPGTRPVAPVVGRSRAGSSGSPRASPQHGPRTEPVYAYVPPLHQHDASGGAGSPVLPAGQRSSTYSGRTSAGFSPALDTYPQAALPIPFSHQTCASDYSECSPSEHMRHVATLPTATVFGPMAGGVPLPTMVSTEGEPSILHQLSAEAGRPAGGRSCPRNALERREWTAEEDETIRNGVKEFGYRWRRIASQLQGRSDDAVRNRWSRLRTNDDAPLPLPGGFGSVGRSSAPETATGVTGEGRVDPPPARRRTSTPASASEEGATKPERVGWTQAEDAIIISSVREIGHKWYRIAQRIPGRTEHAIRNRWQRLLKMVEEQQPPPPALA